MDLGSVPEWLGAVFTGAGFGAAVYQLRLSRLAQESERERAHAEEQERRTAAARSVGVKATWHLPEDGSAVVDYEVLNASPHAVDAAVIQFATDDGYTHGLVLGTLLPGERISDQERVTRSEVVFGEITGGIQLLFTDAYGGHWLRRPGELLPREDMARIC